MIDKGWNDKQPEPQPGPKMIEKHLPSPEGWMDKQYQEKTLQDAQSCLYTWIRIIVIAGSTVWFFFWIIRAMTN